jgi:hypothetical protein
MLNLTIETAAKKAQIERAYEEALETNNIESIVRSLDVNTEDDIIVGISGSHIWVSDKQTGKRHAIITI